MRKVLAVGVVLMAAALLALAYMDTQLTIVLFGFSQNPGSSQAGARGFQSGVGSALQSSAPLVQQAGYVRIVPYLLGVGGLALIVVGSAIPSRIRKKKEELDLQDAMQPPPWEGAAVPNVKPEESSA